MSTQTNIASAAIHVVGQYNDAGKTLVGAYRTGVQRLLGGAASRYSEFLGNRQIPLVSEQIKANLIGAQEKVHGFLSNRLDIDTSRIVNAMDRVAAGTTSGIETVANRVAQIESPAATTVLNALSTVNQPFATVSVQIADRIVAGTKQIEARVSGTEEAAAPVRTVKAKVAAAKKPVRRAARKAA
ncbi:hypothetical protein CY658_30835 [Variovorax sp. RO1]|uniref:hypothetical protein n=1 Tax=unclassified Variovorax TaxID=663243 RepID=UPI000C18270C|nr:MULTISPECIES: hypothetical protein [unclassified Variovorax]PIF75250.1 hypothetical protein CLU95_2396 [Variovorax sp. 54]PLC01589.1 hypothetical protein CY658_30835 [Variovorax sp. RO1]QOF78049.1 hypothetical protein IG196_27675 [Variovorax sp. 38R]